MDIGLLQVVGARIAVHLDLYARCSEEENLVLGELDGAIKNLEQQCNRLKDKIRVCHALKSVHLSYDLLNLALIFPCPVSSSIEALLSQAYP